jgi:hypothetical protein
LITDSILLFYFKSFGAKLSDLIKFLFDFSFRKIFPSSEITATVLHGCQQLYPAVLPKTKEIYIYIYIYI